MKMPLIEQHGPIHTITCKVVNELAKKKKKAATFKAWVISKIIITFAIKCKF